MNWKETNSMKLGIFPTLGILAPELSVSFSSRAGGVSLPPYDSLNLGEGTGDARKRVLENRHILLATLGITPQKTARMGQVHGTKIRIIQHGNLLKGIDGMITSSRNLALVISTADCYPVFLYSPSEKVLAALHVGRTGARDGIIEKAFGILNKKFTVDIGNTLAITGPGICGKCYTVNRSDASSFPADVKQYKQNKWHLDLSGFCEYEFRRAGIQPGNILLSGICTSCTPEHCFSYRRDRGRTGRHWSIAMICSSP